MFFVIPSLAGQANPESGKPLKNLETYIGKLDMPYCQQLRHPRLPQLWVDYRIFGNPSFFCLVLECEQQRKTVTPMLIHMLTATGGDQHIPKPTPIS